MLELYGGPILSLASANEHVPEFEQKICVIKEQVRVVVNSLPVITLPAIMLVHVVLLVLVTKQLNLFPVKGGILAYSLKQIMTGEVVKYKFCSIPFGQYCQISEESIPQNSLVVKIQGALSLDQVIMYKGAINSTL